MDPFAQVVPFGKYRGQDFAALVADHDYVQWLLTQGWFGERYPAIHMVIVNGGTEPQETPAHNAMQLLFLDESLCRAVAMLYHQRLPLSYGDIVPLDTLPGLPLYLAFEQQGIDVSFSMRYDWQRIEGHEVGHCWLSKDHGGCGYSQSGNHQRAVQCDFHFVLELKPSLGDDYPAVLRQILTDMKRIKGRTHGIVICDAWAATGGTFTQVQQLFQHSRVALIPLADVQACADMLP